MLAPKMLLAALVLLLPLLVIAALVIQDKDQQIGRVERETHGIEYLIRGRQLLDLILRDFVAPASEANSAGTAANRSEVERLFGEIDERLTAEGDAFALWSRFAAIRAQWQMHVAAPDTAVTEPPCKLKHAIAADIVDLFRHIGNRSGLAAPPSVETAYLAHLVIRQVPEAVSRIGDSRFHLLNETPPTIERNAASVHHFLNNEWSLTLVHRNIVDDFETAAANNAHLRRRLADAIAAFDRQTDRFHMAVVGNLAAKAEFARVLSETYSIDVLARHAPAGAERGGVEALGGAATGAALALFDRAVVELADQLALRHDQLSRTKFAALFMVVAAGVFAIVAGWRLLNGMTRPLQAEIAERERAEQQARELAAIVESSQDSILVIGRDGLFKSWNRGAEALYGYTAEEAIGQSPEILAPPGLDGETARTVAAALRDGSAPTLETVRRRKDGSLVDVWLRSSPVYDDAGTITGIAIIGRDITARKRAEDALRSKERALAAHVDQLSRTQRELRAHRDHLEELVRERTAEVEAQAAQLEEALRREREYSAMQRKFVGMASHEFRTPLAIIDSSAQRILRRSERPDTAEIALRAGKIRDAVARMLALIESTLNMARIEEGKITVVSEPLDLRALVSDVCGQQQEIATEHSIHVDLAGLPQLITGDRNLLELVFANLLSNAVKYAPDAPDIEVAGWREDGMVAISVTDRGRGIPAEDQPKLFERYYRGSNAHGVAGTGIGLSLVRELVELHGGTIGVESAVGAGATFTVRLPAAYEVTAEPPAESDAPRAVGAASAAA